MTVDAADGHRGGGGDGDALVGQHLDRVTIAGRRDCANQDHVAAGVLDDVAGLDGHGGAKGAGDGIFGHGDLLGSIGDDIDAFAGIGAYRGIVVNFADFL